MRRNAVLAGSIALALLVGFSAPTRAQGHRVPDSSAFQARLGWFFPQGGEEVWTVNEEVFTLSASDFRDATLGLSFVTAFNNRLELGVNADFYDSGNVRSSYRDVVDSAGFPIFHDTRLRMVPLTVDLRVLPAGRYRIRSGGRQVLKPVFYVGAGAGVNLWEYEEFGEFVDFADPALPIFFDRFQDDGAAFAAHALAGVELPFGRTFHLVFEGRYLWSDDTLGQDFAGLGKIDFGGWSTNVGFSWRF